MGGLDPTAVADTLITNRDGIVGPWAPPGTAPAAHDATDPDNVMGLWQPDVRAHIADSELHSRIGFQQSSADKIRVRHLNVPASGSPSYKPLIDLTRPDKNAFKIQLDFLNHYADLRPDRAREILAQIDTPIAFYGSIAFLRPGRTRWTYELLDTAFRLAKFTGMRVKHALACRRPMEYSPQVQPIILTPGHGTLPSGHATEAFAMATVLLGVLQAGGNPVYAEQATGTQIMRQAARIAINRQVAGVHFPVDSIAGALLGIALGQYLVARARPDSSGSAVNGCQSVVFNGAHRDVAESDFIWSDHYDVTKAVSQGAISDGPAYVSTSALDIAVTSTSALNWLWTKVIGEWR